MLQKETYLNGGGGVIKDKKHLLLLEKKYIIKADV